MKKISDGIYKHRNKLIIIDIQGICVEGYLHLFKTVTDAQIFIDKMHSKEAYKKWRDRKPKIIGEWHE